MRSLCSLHTGGIYSLFFKAARCTLALFCRWLMLLQRTAPPAMGIVPGPVGTGAGREGLAGSVASERRCPWQGEYSWQQDHSDAATQTTCMCEAKPSVFYSNSLASLPQVSWAPSLCICRALCLRGKSRNPRPHATSSSSD